MKRYIYFYLVESIPRNYYQPTIFNHYCRNFRPPGLTYQLCWNCIRSLQSLWSHHLTLAYDSITFIIQIGIGSISLVVSFVLKFIPYGKTEHNHEETGGIGNQVGEIRRKSVLSLKRIEERVERDLAKNHLGH